jgi:hypothetical protein
MEIALAFIVSAMNILCFVIGARVGQSVSKGEEVKLPTINPMEIAQEHRAKQEAKKEQSRIDTIMKNIENYDGTGKGQEDVPRG